MKFVNDVYTSTFKDCVSHTSKTHGYTLPEDIEAYVAILLGSFVERTTFLPDKSFAEAYTKLSNRQSSNAKELADVCLFVVGVFPTYGSRYGITKEYYANIGKASYDIASKSLNYNLFSQLCQHFDIVTHIIMLSTTPPKHTSRIY